MWAGIPYCPVSPAYSLVAGELSRLRYVIDLLTPGLVAAFDTPRFERALSCIAADVEVVGDARLHDRPVSTLDSLEHEDPARVADAHAATDMNSIVRFLLTSGSTGHPKAVITTNRMCCSNAAMLLQSMPFLATEPPVLLDCCRGTIPLAAATTWGMVLAHGGSLYIDDGRPTPAGLAETVRNLREIAPTVYFNVPKGFEMLAPHLRDDAALRQKFYSRLRAYFFAGASMAQHTWDELDAASIRELGGPHADAVRPRRDGNRSFRDIHNAANGTQRLHRAAGGGSSREARACGGKAGDSRARPVSDRGILASAGADQSRPSMRKASIVWAMR
jgi:feruloyl-CoA synthase